MQAVHRSQRNLSIYWLEQFVNRNRGYQTSSQTSIKEAKDTRVSASRYICCTRRGSGCYNAFIILYQMRIGSCPVGILTRTLRKDPILCSILQQWAPMYAVQRRQRAVSLHWLEQLLKRYRSYKNSTKATKQETKGART